MPQKSSDRDSQNSDYPLAQSEATKTLAAALKQIEEDKGLSQRAVAKLLNYKSSVVLSHMALGRVPIPIDRALDIARLLKIDAPRFLLAVLQQRHPDIDFPRLLSQATGTKQAQRDKKTTQNFVLSELEAIAGKSLDDLPTEKINTLLEVAGEPDPARRWLSFTELPTIQLIRQKMPQGLSPADRVKLAEFLETLQ